MIRPPAVAGRFYPDDPSKLRETVDLLLGEMPERKMRAVACMVPHAGYQYSGRIAGEVYQRLEVPARVILVGPRHHPRGAPLAILSCDGWQTPLAVAQIDEDLAKKLSRACSLLREDAVAHSAEHSLEVQLPFLQRLSPSLKFVPIVTGPVRYEDLELLGHAIAEVIRAEAEPILLIASSDMNHYESDDVTRVKDRKAIERILALDPRALFDTVRGENISMCGYGAAVAMLTTAKALGAKRVDLLGYATSAEVNGDFKQVVGYAGITVA